MLYTKDELNSTVLEFKAITHEVSAFCKKTQQANSYKLPGLAKRISAHFDINLRKAAHLAYAYNIYLIK